MRRAPSRRGSCSSVPGSHPALRASNSVARVAWVAWGVSLGLLSAPVGATLGCGGTKQAITREASRPTRPEWLSAPPREAGTLLVVGQTTGASSLEEGKRGAFARAAEQAAAFIEARVRGELEATSSSRDARDHAEERIRVVTAARVRDLMVVDEYHERTQRLVGGYFDESFDVYLLARMPLEAASAERSRLLEEGRSRSARAEAAHRAAQEARTAGQWARAQALLAEARGLLEDADPATAVPGPHGDVATLRSAVAEASRDLEASARSATVFLERDTPGAELLPLIETEVLEALGRARLRVGPEDGHRGAPEPRFRVTLSAAARRSGQVFGQDVRFVSARGVVHDLWSAGAAVGAAEREGRGFGHGESAATHEAAHVAGRALAAELVALIDGAAPARDP